ncbi:MAG: Mrp/NBP35 family ATP-binding protein [Acholeplasmatales bacterium]|jgi:ATP-binding protein involved in chromosome partitioning|nr:Mrp/NBP35 family ATP-binding protein [Acholeplasmatales bacterium]
MKQILSKIKLLKVNEINKTLQELHAISNVSISDDDIVDISFTNLTKTQFNNLKREITKIVKLDLGHKGIKLTLKEEKETVEEENPLNSRKTKFIAIESGKGGVGKSTITANLALSFKRKGFKVGIIDCDIYGPTIPLLFDINDCELLMKEEKIIPYVKDSIQIVSAALLIPDNRPIMWRAPMLNKLLSTFFNDTLWNEDLDYIFIDMPPGTGDVSIDLKNFVKDAKVIIVTTNDIVASKIAVKAGLGAIELGHEILGVIENMSYIYNNEKINPFNLKKFSIEKELNTVILGSIPFFIGSGLIEDKRKVFYDILGDHILERLN